MDYIRPYEATQIHLQDRDIRTVEDIPLPLKTPDNAVHYIAELAEAMLLDTALPFKTHLRMRQAVVLLAEWLAMQPKAPHTPRY